MAHGSALWLPFVQPFGTVLLGLGAFTIAYRQWQTANDKLRLELFDRRLATIVQMRTAIEQLRPEDGDGAASFQKIMDCCRVTTLIFGDDIKEHCDKITKELHYCKVLHWEISEGEIAREPMARFLKWGFQSVTILPNKGFAESYSEIKKQMNYIDARSISYMRISVRSKNDEAKYLMNFLMLPYYVTIFTAMLTYMTVKGDFKIWHVGIAASKFYTTWKKKSIKRNNDGNDP